MFLIFEILTYKDTPNYGVLWHIKTLTCQCFKTTGPILMKFKGITSGPIGACIPFFRAI